MSDKLSWLRNGCLGLLTVFSISLSVFAAPMGYVANRDDNTVSVLDMATNRVVDTIPVGLAPRGVTILPDAQTVYVANRDGDSVSVIDVATNTVIATIPVGADPRGAAAVADGSLVYVANRREQTVSVIDPASNTVVDTIVGLPYAIGLTAHPTDSGLMYLSHLKSGGIGVIDTTTNTVGATLSQLWVIGMGISPDGSIIYGSNRTGDTVSVYNTATNTVDETISVGDVSLDIAVHPSGKWVYVPNPNLDALTVIETATNTPITVIPLGAGNAGSAISVHPAGTSVYIGSGEKSGSQAGIITIVDVVTNTVAGSIEVGRNPTVFGDFIAPMGIGGAFTGMNGTRFSCVNDTQATTPVNAKLRAAIAWDCEARGLDYLPGDSISMSVSGNATDDALLFAGGVTGIFSMEFVRCENRTTRQVVSTTQPDGGTLWNCEEMGLVVNPNDRLTVSIIGTAQ